MTVSAARAVLLLSTYNGARFLPAQLASLAAQSEPGWVLYWRDDGSSDETVSLMESFSASAGAGRCERVGGAAHLGARASFFALLQAAVGRGLPVGFMDQDDVWRPEKLAWALAALEGVHGPALYASRQLLVDEAMRPLGESPRLRRVPSLPSALAQNVVTGCTTVLNPAAARLVAASVAPEGTLHDWWSYLVVMAAGGRLVFDERPTLHYRQHGGNLVGAPPSLWQRAQAALRRGPRQFMGLLRAHVTALLAQREMLAPESVEMLQGIDQALRGGWLGRAGALRLAGFGRQTAAETAVFRLWFLLG